MDYAATNAIAGSALGQASGQYATKAQEAPRTISSAIGRMDSVNDRLSKINESLAMIASQMGALTGINNGIAAGRESTPVAAGAIHRLNESADVAHTRLAEIEATISGIGRALG